LLHRALSVFIFNSQGEMLLQKRATFKYHFGGLWTNACCSHPRPGENIRTAANRRLMEELGIAGSLQRIGYLLYSCKDEQSGLTEFEYDHIFSGYFNGPIMYNEKEVADVKWISRYQLSTELERYPHLFTPWFKLIMQEQILSSRLMAVAKST
jgi:isopentenyl-diphosphate delta-isomerase